MAESDGPPRAALIAALVLAIGAVVVILAIAATRHHIAPVGAAAWQPAGEGDPVILRCGLDRPTDFVIGSPIQQVDRVQWFQVSQDQRSTWYAVDRQVYLALTLPPGSGPTPIQQLSELIDRTMPARPVAAAPGN